MPASDGGNDFVGIGGPSEGRRLQVMFFEEAVDGGLQVETDLKTPRFNRRFVRVAKKPSTALSHEQEVGVKWKTNRGCRASH